MLDESLALLLNCLKGAQAQLSNFELSEDIVTPFSTVLAGLASVHMDAFIRHLALRLLSLVLALSPQLLRLQILVELTSESSLPQMRAAAVGLVKEAVLEPLSSSTATSSIFVSPVLVQALGPHLFRPSPPDFFSSPLSAADIRESLEFSRLSECLSFYYVLLKRDVRNQVGSQRSNLPLVSHLLNRLACGVHQALTASKGPCYDR